MKKLPLVLLTITSLLSLPSLPVRAADSAATDSLLANGDFETDSKGEKWPDGWSKPKGATWEEEGGNHFVRLVSGTPGETVMIYKEVNVPPGTPFLEVTFRYRTAGVQKGAQSWFDARSMFQFMDSSRGEITPAPGPLVFSLSADNWEEKSKRIKVPEGAAILKLMPCLFQVEAGTLDLDEIVVTPVEDSGSQ